MKLNQWEWTNVIEAKQLHSETETMKMIQWLNNQGYHMSHDQSMMSHDTINDVTCHMIQSMMWHDRENRSHFIIYLVWPCFKYMNTNNLINDHSIVQFEC